MIKINLAVAAKKQFGAAAPSDSETVSSTKSIFSKFKGGAGSSALSGLGDSAKFRQLVIMVVALLAGYYFLDSYKEEEMRKAEAAVVEAQSRLTALSQKLEQAKQYDQLKKDLEADETAIRLKIDSIQRLLDGRGTSGRILVSLSNAIPKEVWLNELNFADSKLTIKGASQDFNRLSEFLKSLNENVLFVDTALTSTQQSRDDTGRDLATFEMVAKRR